MAESFKIILEDHLQFSRMECLETKKKGKTSNHFTAWEVLWNICNFSWIEIWAIWIDFSNSHVRKLMSRFISLDRHFTVICNDFFTLFIHFLFHFMSGFFVHLIFIHFNLFLIWTTVFHPASNFIYGSVAFHFLVL